MDKLAIDSGCLAVIYYRKSEGGELDELSTLESKARRAWAQTNRLGA